MAELPVDSAPRRNQVPAAVLIVDDRPANLLALEAILEPLSLRVVKANSGEEALKCLLVEDFALVLLDVQMPGIDGFTTASLIRQRKRNQHLPIIFLTALSRDAKHVFEGYAHGAVDYLVKPFDTAILRSKVSVFVDLYRKEVLLKKQAEQLKVRELDELARKADRRLRGLLELMPQCVLAVRPDGRVYYANRVWMNFLGLDSERDAPVGFIESGVIHDDDRADLEAVWSQALESQAPFEAQARLKRAIDGEYRWHMLRAVPEQDERGELQGYIATATDVHEQRVVQDALEKSEASLRAANEAKDAFIAAASHELRTPLAAAKGHAHLALLKLGGETSGPAAKSYQVILRQIDRMTRLVEDLLDVSRLQAGRLDLEQEEFDAVELVDEASERIRSLSAQHEISLHCPERLKVVGDRHRLDQVVTNLLSNAVRYSPGGGPINLTLAQLGTHLRLSVADKGVGIPKEKQNLLFERFGSAHGSKYGGLGLGLVISQGIVEQHGGRIWFESSGVPDEGSTFIVEMPLRPTMRVGPGAPGQAPDDDAEYSAAAG